ncbi:hypothetical protein GGS26DRAFT_285726 [Hypomontagnella submonticulosa]|nr:hypothetical protein GGS26DRAFT_285726 [Hypomontagnella submonticulosa]
MGDQPDSSGSRPKSILKQRAQGDKMVPTAEYKETTTTVAFDDVVRNLETGETEPLSTKSRSEYLSTVRQRVGASLIDMFRAREQAAKALEAATESLDNKAKESSGETTDDEV